MTAAAAVGRESGMTQKSNLFEMSALCVLFILLSLWGIVWDFTSGLLTSGIDGIMLVAICLMMGGIFSVMLVVMLWQAGLIPIFKPKEAKEAASAKPAAAAKPATPAPAASPAPAQTAPATAPAQKPAPPAQTSPTK
jgi:pyruvate/2-oxoglutarate dehydrogenase complex dihydrolipoamide acyltransferase (E2) component